MLRMTGKLIKTCMPTTRMAPAKTCQYHPRRGHMSHEQVILLMQLCPPPPPHPTHDYQEADLKKIKHRRYFNNVQS